jgi:hypothetical protein
MEKVDRTMVCQIQQEERTLLRAAPVTRSPWRMPSEWRFPMLPGEEGDRRAPSKRR